MSAAASGGGPLRRRPARRPGGTKGSLRSLAGIVRWLHLYLSMFAFGTMMLFSVTGLTLNHPEWFGAGKAVTVDLAGEIDRDLLGDASEDPRGDRVDRLAVAETLRARHRLHGAVADFRCDELEVSVGWKGPARAADAVIDRDSGRYTLTVTRHGFVDLVNDLHKGRDTGPFWSAVIDLSALLLVIAAVTGFLLVFWMRRKRLAGILVALAGMIAILAAAARFVP